MHELRALKRRILRAEAGGTPDLASRRAFNAELRASRLALRAGGGEEHESKITVENLKQILEGIPQMQIIEEKVPSTDGNGKVVKYFLEARLSQNSSDYDYDHFKLTLGNETKYHDIGGYHSYQIFINETKDCWVDIRFRILHELKRDIETTGVKLPDLKKRWRVGPNFIDKTSKRERVKEIRKFLSELNDTMKDKVIRSKVIDTIVQHFCKISLGGCPLGGGMVTFMYDDQSTTSDHPEVVPPEVVPPKDYKIKILASAEILKKIKAYSSKAADKTPGEGDDKNTDDDDEDEDDRSKAADKTPGQGDDSEIVAVRKENERETTDSVNLLKKDLGDRTAAEVVAEAEENGNIKTLCGIKESASEFDHTGSRQNGFLNAPDAVLLSFDLKLNRSLKSAKLGNNDIGDEGTAALSKALKLNSTLEKLDLSRNKIGAVGAQSFAKMLKVNRSLTSVNLLKNDLGDGAAAVVAAAKQHGKIKTLCGIEEGQTKVHLKPRTIDDILKAPDAVLLSFDLEFNRALTTLNLASHDIGVPDGWFIERTTRGSFKQYKHTGGRTQKERPQGTSSGVVALAESLTVNRALKSADLSDNNIGTDGIRALCDALKTNKSLDSLTIQNRWGTQIDAAGAQLIADMLVVNSSLNSLDLCNNDLGEASETIAQAVLQHPTMEVFCKIPMKKMREDLLTELDLHVKGIGPPGAMVIAPLLQFSRSLKSAKLGINDIGYRGTTALSDALKTNSTLEELDLGYNMIGVAGARSLADMLKDNRALISANLANNDIEDEGAIAISAALKTNSTLTSINLGGNSIKKGKSLADMLGVNRALKSVHLGNNSIGDEGTEEICKALKSNNKPNNNSYNSTLEELELAGNEIGAAGARSLAEMLQFNGALTTLDLGSNDIGVPDGWSIEEGEDNKVTYKHEDGRTQKDHPQGTSSCVSALAESLKVNSSLKSADLSSNHIGDDGISNLCDALKENNSLESLTIENPRVYLDTKIGAVGAQSLADMLKVNRSLKSAKLGGNSFGDEGTEALSDALKTNSTLKTLELYDNKIGDNGAQALADMLRVNGALTSVDLTINFKITNEGKKKLRHAVKGKDITLEL